MKIILRLTLLGFLFLGSNPILAQQSAGKVSFGLFGSAIKLVGGNQDDGMVSPWSGLSLGYAITPTFGLEVTGAIGWDQPRDPSVSGLMQYFTVRPGTPYRTYLYPVIANLKIGIRPGKKTNPYLEVGGGLLFWDLRDVSGDNRFLPVPAAGKRVNGTKLKMNALGNVAAGIEFFTSENFSIDVSGRYQQLVGQYNDMSGLGDVQTGNFEGRLGLRLYFGGWRDADNDQIEDKLDKCPKNAEDFDGYLDGDGCPELDNDGDGIPDDRDQAPDRPEDLDGFQDGDGVPDLDNDQDGIADEDDAAPNIEEDVDGFADKDGAPDFDNDNDGLADIQDQCPDQAETYNDFEDADGCPDKKPEIIIEEEKPIVLDGVTFEINSAELTDNAMKVLEPVIRTLNDYPEMVVEVRGHTDNTGNADYNLLLSQRRADSVKNHLVGMGIDASRLRSVGFGQEQPIAPNTTREGRAQNRRIEFIRLH